MPKQRRPARSRRRRTGRPPVVPPQSAAPPPIATDAGEEEGLAPTPISTAGPRQAPVRAERAVERAPHRTVMVDYGYVTRDLRAILILATAVIVTIVILSFFLP